MDYQIKGKTAYVCAGGHGIGEAIADLLTQEGVSVVVSARNEASLREKAHKWTGVVAADLSTAEGIEKANAEVLRVFGEAPDILINNLGVGDAAVFEEISDERWSHSFSLNFMGTVRTCRAFLPLMLKRGGGAVVNMGSDLAKQPEETMMDYGAFKASLLYLTKALAKQYAPKVRVNVVMPGPIMSGMWTRPGGLVDQAVEKYGLAKEAALGKFLSERYMPLGIGEPIDVAYPVVFLASPLAKFISGSTLDICGTLRGLI
jgi:NAD(P)-dependent dehydrogenase (short-subunit alcohol dehydrogenase family)